MKFYCIRCGNKADRRMNRPKQCKNQERLICNACGFVEMVCITTWGIEWHNGKQVVVTRVHMFESDDEKHSHEIYREPLTPAHRVGIPNDCDIILVYKEPPPVSYHHAAV